MISENQLHELWVWLNDQNLGSIYFEWPGMGKCGSSYHTLDHCNIHHTDCAENFRQYLFGNYTLVLSPLIAYPDLATCLIQRCKNTYEELNK